MKDKSSAVMLAAAAVMIACTAGFAVSSRRRKETAPVIELTETQPETTQPVRATTSAVQTTAKQTRAAKTTAAVTSTASVTTAAPVTEPETEPKTEPALTLEDIAPIDLNTAGKDELMLLPHVDEHIAEEIIELREKIGGYSHVYELLYIDDLAQNEVADILDFVIVVQ